MDGGSSSTDSTPEGGKPLPLEDSAERMSRKAAAAGAAGEAAPAAVAAAAVANKRPPGLPVASSQLQLDVRASASSEKLGSIMRMIERLEAQAVEEARQLAPTRPPPLPHAAPGHAHARGEAGGQAPAPDHPPSQPGHALSRLLAAQPLSINSKRLAAAAATDAAASTAVKAINASRVVRRSAELLTCSAPPATAPSSAAGAEGVVAAPAATAQPPTAAAAAAPAVVAQPAPATGPLLPLPGTGGSSLSASAVASTVRAKIQALQAAVAEREGQLEELKRQVASHQAQHEAALRAAEDGHRVGGVAAAHMLCSSDAWPWLQHAGYGLLKSTTCEQCPPAHAAVQPLLPYQLQAQLVARRAEAEAAAARSLQFIDRVMADKEALAGGQESGWQGGLQTVRG